MMNFHEISALITKQGKIIIGCAQGKPGGCERNSVGYRITCASCQEAGKAAVYQGESGRNAYSRGLEHQNDLRLEVEDSPLWKN